MKILVRREANRGAGIGFVKRSVSCASNETCLMTRKPLATLSRMQNVGSIQGVVSKNHLVHVALFN